MNNYSSINEVFLAAAAGAAALLVYLKTRDAAKGAHSSNERYSYFSILGW